MDPFAHLPQIKLLATLAIGFFCYRKFSRMARDDVQLSSSESEQQHIQDEAGCQQEKQVQHNLDVLEEQPQPIQVISTYQAIKDIQIEEHNSNLQSGEVEIQKQEEENGTKAIISPQRTKKIEKKEKKSKRRIVRRKLSKPNFEQTHQPLVIEIN